MRDPTVASPQLPNRVKLSNRIFASEAFRKSHRLSSFLRYIFEQYSKGQVPAINEARIGTEVFGRPSAACSAGDRGGARDSLRKGPEFYDGRDKAFFFAAFEGMKLTQGDSYNAERPTLQMRNADFSQLLDSGTTHNADGAIGCSNGSTCVFDPATGKQFPGNIIPISRVNTVDHYQRAFYGPKPAYGADSLQGGNLKDGEHTRSRSSTAARFS